jgi:hypothetical protein
MIRDTAQARLAEWLAVGRGLLERYGELRGTIDDDADQALETIINARRPLLDRLERVLVERGELPPAGKLELNQVQAAIDSLAARLLGDQAVQQRLLRAEAHWQALLADDPDLDWQQDEQQVIAALRDDSRRAIDSLQSL